MEQWGGGGAAGGVYRQDELRGVKCKVFSDSRENNVAVTLWFFGGTFFHSALLSALQ